MGRCEAEVELVQSGPAARLGAKSRGEVIVVDLGQGFPAQVVLEGPVRPDAVAEVSLEGHGPVLQLARL